MSFLPAGEPGPEPDTTDAAEPDDVESPVEPEDAPEVLDRRDDHVDDLDV